MMQWQQRMEAWKQAHIRLRCKAVELWRLGELLIEEGEVGSGLVAWEVAWKCLRLADEIARWKLTSLCLGFDLRLKR